ncbi:MAG: hypothetical protein MR711_01120 [Selenomonas sp.]|uniref:hypothetical protein n=1 Tax=Selenomonas sp. TaxID=2053611 RepID=UPI0025D376BB|nr:hypothetical protein [Selenomonas sp.]MCI6084851.1 hypothetical protein [Selenomonas sp.]
MLCYLIRNFYEYNIHHVMDRRLEEIQDAMEQKMAQMTLANVVEDTETLIEQQNTTAC